jgi:hypothetical protein
MSRLLLDGVVMATFSKGTWKSDEPGLARLLETARGSFDIGGAEPDPDLAVASAAAARLGNGWTAQSVRHPSFDPAVVY